MRREREPPEVSRISGSIWAWGANLTSASTARCLQAKRALWAFREPASRHSRGTDTHPYRNAGRPEPAWQLGMEHICGTQLGVTGQAAAPGCSWSMLASSRVCAPCFMACLIVKVQGQKGWSCLFPVPHPNAWVPFPVCPMAFPFRALSWPCHPGCVLTAERSEHANAL